MLDLEHLQNKVNNARAGGCAAMMQPLVVYQALIDRLQAAEAENAELKAKISEFQNRQPIAIAGGITDCPVKGQHDWPIDDGFVSVTCLYCGYHRVKP